MKRRARAQPATLFSALEDAESPPFAPAIVAGIDEAGLGPLLGPLAVGTCAFRVPREIADLWDALAASVASDPSRDEERVVVADSKVVFDRTPRGARRLETTVLVFDALRRGSSSACGSPRDFLDGSPFGVPEIRDEIWFARIPARLASDHDETRLDAHVAALTRTARAARIDLVGYDVRVVPAAALNASFAATDNKSETHWHACAPLVVHAFEHWALEGLALAVDRHGGRMRYRDQLQAALPRARVRTLRERPVISEYDVTDDAGRAMRIVFVEKAETLSFQVALASCLAKYAREACMHAFNAYFCELQEGLEPTAGYHQDGRRWLERARPAIERSGLPLERLVRSR